MEFITRFFDPPKVSFFLLGPRGTGKSTLLRRLLPDSLYLDLSLPDLYRDLESRPERLADMVRAHPPDGTVVIDEIQRVPELLNLVHHYIESSRPYRFVLSGSSARKLRRGGVNLLGGRALNCELHPFMLGESQKLSLGSALTHGTLPMVMASTTPDSTLRAYATLYLEQEIKQEGWARRAGDFARFLEAMSFSHGSVLNVANVARDCGLQTRTTSAYVEILEDLLLGFRIPVFTSRAQRKTVMHPKFYYFDTGVFRSVRPRGPTDRVEEIEGASLEGLVAQHLRAWISYARDPHRLYYWRTPSGTEVDFVLQGPTGLLALEVKNATRIQDRDVRALRSFKADYPDSVCALLYRGEHRLVQAGILCVPVVQFLKDLVPSRHPLDGLRSA